MLPDKSLILADRYCLLTLALESAIDHQRFEEIDGLLGERAACLNELSMAVISKEVAAKLDSGREIDARTIGKLTEIRSSVAQEAGQFHMSQKAVLSYHRNRRAFQDVDLTG